jgi:hypothetical protein
MDAETRIERLERSLRRTRGQVRIAWLLAIVALLAAAYATPLVPGFRSDSLETREILLMDEDGLIRGQIYAHSQAAGVELYDAQGAIAADLHVADSVAGQGSVLGELRLFGRADSGEAEIRLAAADSRAGLDLDAEGLREYGVRVRAGHDGQSAIEVISADTDGEDVQSDRIAVPAPPESPVLPPPPTPPTIGGPAVPMVPDVPGLPPLPREPPAGVSSGSGLR